VEAAIFLDFSLPNAVTWFYFSLILGVALFFQFSRPFSLRNLDILSLYLLAPGFLILQEAHHHLAVGRTERGQRELYLGYGWLLAATGYWFVRTLCDLALVRRPMVSPNLTTAGLVCLAVAMFAGQSSVALRQGTDLNDQLPLGNPPGPLARVQDGAAAVVQQAPGAVIRQASAEEVRFWAERSLCVLCHAAIVVALLMTGLRHFQDRAAGIGMATLYLLVPYTAYEVGRQLHHVWPAAFVTWAVFFYRRPSLSGWLIGLATGTSFFPILLYPLWFGFYSRRGAYRFGLSFLSAVAISLTVTTFLLPWDGRAGLGLLAALDLPDWQPWRVPIAESVWTGSHWAYRMPLFVLYVGFLIGATVWPNPKNLSHLIALTAALILGTQFWHADRGGVYVMWYLPLLILLVFRPNLTAAEPPAVEPGGGLMARLATAAWRRVRPARNEPTKELAV
jgi:hypothetical protein